MTALKPGTQAPEFSLSTTPDQKVCLSDFRGHPVVLVFYPADWSPVCSDQLALYNELKPEFAERGQAIGTWSGFTAIAAGIGPVLGGWLVEQFSWPWIFFINIPLAAVALLIAWQRVPESRNEESKGSLDWQGAALVTFGLTGIVFGLIESNSRSLPIPLLIGSLAIGVNWQMGVWEPPSRFSRNDESGHF